MTAPFLSRFETRRLQAMYEAWLKTLKPDSISHKLFELNLLSSYEFAKYDSIKTTQDKSAYLFHNVLMKSTYDDMCKIRRYLIQSGMSVHINLAKLMPDRGEIIDFEDRQPETPVTQNGSCSRYKEGGYNEVEMKEDNRDSYDLNDGEEIGISGRRTGPVSKSAAIPEYRSYTEPFPIYEVKDGSVNKTTGQGLCVIIRNFTDDLQGYKADSDQIERFFKSLDYMVWVGNTNTYKLLDLTKKQFMTNLTHLQAHLQNPFNSRIDRFFMFILSHGEEEGIKMCKEGSKREEEIDPDTKKPVMVPIEEITKMFTHDKIPNLKGFPKVFMIQCCQGTEVAKPAASADSSQMLTSEDKRDWNPPSANIVVGADVMVCLPCEKGTLSWVPSTGSHFIRETMALLNEYHDKEHLVDIMVQLNGVMSRKQFQGKVKDDGPEQSVCQMPGHSCSLTKKFYLSIPDSYKKKAN